MKPMMKAAMIAGLCAILGACAETPKEATPAPVALPPAPPPGEPAWSAGMDAQGLRVAFGAPAFVRKDGAAEIWRYDSTACKAFFFLYPNATGATVVRHVETLPRGPVMAADETCLAQMRTRPANTPVS
jgi:hypothetical protein